MCSKISFIPLSSALKKLDLIKSSTDDSIEIGVINSSKTLIQSVDGFPSLVSDPWLNGRLLAFHSCSDIWACGGSVISAQSVLSLPSLSNNLEFITKGLKLEEWKPQRKAIQILDINIR